MNGDIPLPVGIVKVTPGLIEYENRQGDKKKFYFQANPTTFTRSRNITLTQTNAAEQSGTQTDRGKAGRKYSLKADNWKIEGIEINLDAARPHWTDTTSQVDTDNLKAVVEALAHLESLADSGPLKDETNNAKSFPQHPSPPLVTLTLGTRIWKGYVTSIRIEEKQFTHDLIPSRIRATLGFEVIQTIRQLDADKIGGKQ